MSRAPRPAVAVVVPVRLRRDEERGQLDACLRALAALDPAPAELVVVDDGSARPVQAPVRVVRTPPRGPAAARNAGAAATTAPILAFVDADVVVPQGALATLCAALEARPAAVAAWATVTAAHPHRGLLSRYKNLTHRHFTLQQGAPQATPAGVAVVPTRHLTSMLVAVRRDAFEAVGGFDEALRTVSVEDVELGRALFEAGGEVLLVPEVQVVHHHRFTAARAVRNDFHKLRHHAAATLARRRAGHRAVSVEGPGERRQVRYLLTAPLGVGAVAAALTGRGLVAGALLLALAVAERDLLRLLARHEGPGFALALLPWMAVERTVAVAAIGAALVDAATGGSAGPADRAPTQRDPQAVRGGEGAQRDRPAQRRAGAAG